MVPRLQTPRPGNDPTAIVISMALTAFILTLAYRQYRYRTDDVIEDDAEDTAIAAKAARPGNAAASPDHDASNDPTTGRATKEGDNFGPESFEEPVKGPAMSETMQPLVDALFPYIGYLIPCPLSSRR